MPNKLPLLALLAVGVTFQTCADSPLLPSPTTQDRVGEESGIVRFHGSVYASTCVLTTKSRIQDIELGEISARQFHQAGDRSQPVRFTLYLKDCLKGASQARTSLGPKSTGDNWRAYSTSEQAVQVTFIGESDINNRQLIRTTGSTQGAGVRLMDMKGNALEVNQTHRPYLVNPGDSELNFLAALESTGTNVLAGEFSGLVRLKMEYL
ncbi:MrfE family protein [Trabulsiella guamensis ATCC 49490]|uniref:MrfE family protein n=1 Tax=Trabulsiella guamensis ATCC 49490 TaxID=1005994 RepID=A0A084ZMQ4_9ENTR|nr:fimbrial protein [Trabulsiella guamensis]KFB98748.1 MrfE family protein [Trabulsiella guamensis ATCC 49490]